MAPNSSRRRVYTFPRGKAACATRRVSSGTGGISWGCSDMLRLLHQGYGQAIGMKTHHASRCPRHLGKHSQEFATSINTSFTPVGSQADLGWAIMPKNSILIASDGGMRLPPSVRLSGKLDGNIIS